MRFAIISALFCLPLLHTAACSSDNTGDDGDAEPFDTYADCYYDHHNEESLPIGQAIVVCCIDHPIGADDPNVVCGETELDCEDYVDANIGDDTVTAGDITAACEDYITQRSE